MSNRLIRAFNEATWAMLPGKLDAIQELLVLRAQGEKFSDEEIAARIGGGPRAMEPRAVGENLVVIPVHGVIAHRAESMVASSGGTSTEKLAARMKEAAGDGAQIVLDVNSPGGSTAGLPELAATMRDLRAGGTKITAVVNDLAASAAYWIASQADQVVITPSGLAGSVGVFQRHIDVSAMEEDQGIKVTLIHAGPFKVEGNPHEPLSEEAREYAQSVVDDYYAQFVSDVARGRGVPTSRVVSSYGGGRVLTAERALEAGMVDRIASLDQVLGEFGVRRSGGSGRRRAAATPLAPAAGTQTMTVSAGFISPDVRAVPADTASDGAEVTVAEQAPTGQEETVSQQDTTAAQQQNGAADERPEAAVADVRRDAEAGERERVTAVLSLAKAHNMADRAQEWVAEGLSVGQVANKIAAITRENRPAPVQPGAAAPDISPKERREYSISRLIRSQLDGEDAKVDAGYELEVSQEMARMLDMDPKGVFMSTALAFGRPEAALDTATTTAGEELVFTEFGGFIDLLRPRSAVLRLGAQMLPGLRGNVAIPRLTGGSDGAWVAETPGTDVSDSDATLDQVTLSPNTYQASTAYSRQLLRQSTPIVDQIVRLDLIRKHATALDAAAINGAGGNAPTGVLSQSGIGDVVGGTDGAVPDFGNIIELETDVAAANADDLGAMAYLSTPGIRGVLKQTAEYGTDRAPIWRGSGENQEVNGYRAEVSTNVPSDLDKGSSTGVCHAIIFGVWSQMLIGEWGAADLIVDPYRLKKQGVIEVTSFQMVDVALRHGAAFSAMQDALLS